MRAEPRPSIAGPLRLSYREAGQGRPVVLLHGFPTDGRIFDAQLAAAASGELPGRLVVPDLPGFGGTPLPDAVPRVLDIAALADAVADLIRELTPERVVAGGVAIGGYVSIELAARHPALVSALVLMGTKAAPDPPKMAPQREEVALLALEHGSRTVADQLADRPLGPGADPSMRARMHTLISEADPRAIAALVRGLARRPDPTRVLESLEIPVLVLCGTDDPFTSVEEARRLARTVPRGRLTLLEGVGHVAPLEAPQQVTSAIATLLAEVPR